MDAFVNAPLVRAVALALLHFVWQGALVALALWLVLRLLRRADSRVRYLISCIALAVAFALPIVTAQSLLASARPVVLEGGDSAPLPLPWHAYVAPVLVALWISGAVLRLVRAGVGLYRIRALVRSAQPLRQSVAERVRRVARTMGLARVPRLFETDRIDVPAVVGWLRPAVLVPISAISALPPAQLDAVLAHELSHVRRYDFLVNLFQEVAVAVLFFHPAVHFISRSIREEREKCADDDAAQFIAPEMLAYALFALESQRANFPELSLGGTGGNLVNRVQRLLEQRPSRAPMPVLISAGFVLISALFGLGSCGSTGDESSPSVAESDSPDVAEVAEVEPSVRIRWLPPVLLPYKGMFEGAAKKHGIDADTLAIVALLESSGDPDAESPRGALGLMQIMPKTGSEIAKERGVADFSPTKLRDPSLNVDFGAYYLAQQASLLRGREGEAKVELVSAAYNAGPEAVKAYLDGARPLPEETVRYKALVAGMYEERLLERSPTFDAWRGRVRARAAEHSGSVVDQARVTAGYGAKGEMWRDKAHSGVDLAAKSGTEIHAPLDGSVVKTSYDEKQGHVIVMRHSGGIETRYHHLGTVAVKAGDRVGQGNAIGTIGSTGVSTGPHVHFEVHDLGAVIDPTPFLKAKP